MSERDLRRTTNDELFMNNGKEGLRETSGVALLIVPPVEMGEGTTAFGLTSEPSGETEALVGVAYCDESDPASTWNAVAVREPKPPPLQPNIPFEGPAPVLGPLKIVPLDCLLEDPTTLA